MPSGSRIPLERITNALADANLLVETRGSLPSTIANVWDDSRRVSPGDLFVAVKGSDRDGHEFLESAQKAGAAAAVTERVVATSLPTIIVRDGRRAAAIVGAAAFDFPARQLQLIGCTGTNGKTTVVHMLRHLFDDVRARSASIGTIGILHGSEGRELADMGLTTPGPVDLQRVLRTLADDGVRYVAMEVSSHALEQRRVEGLSFDVAIFTNLSRDHLDYHGSMEKYLAAKARLLEYMAPHGTVVVNLDDIAWRSLSTERRRMSFSTRVRSAEVHAEDVSYTSHGSAWTLVLPSERTRVELPLIGDFNVSNALAAAAAAFALGMPTRTIAERLRTLPQTPGRLEVVHGRPTVLRDYAHTPDALERTLQAVRPFARRRLLVVFGCGGDRDRGKRPQMGGIAERLADLAIVTSDNPRTEDPERILDDIEAGMSRGNHERIEDRRKAIARALDVAEPDDVIVLAGKGHETYQIRGTEKLPFDEKQIVAELSEERV
jgi:UDP-N-acetylmuramoyl-L-alanyl-D-glutamate--2,6-diaminopimelate ligase